MVDTIQLQTYTVQQANQWALTWCAKHPGWKPIAGIPDSDALYKTWDELNRREQGRWRSVYGRSARDAWESLGSRRCKVPTGFISGAGAFYRKSTEVPLGHSFMMVFRIGVE